MEQIKVTGKLSAAERETILSYDCESKMWVMYSMVPKHYNKAKKQGWVPLKEYIKKEDGTICGMVLTAPARAITIRNAEKKVMSEKQLNNLSNDDDE